MLKEFGVDKHINDVSNRVYSPSEEKFKKAIYDKYRITVIESYYWDMGQFNIRLWCDFCDIRPEYQFFSEYIRSAQPTVLFDEGADDTGRIFNDIILMYLDAFGFTKEVFTSFAITVRDYYEALKGYAYGHAINDIKNILLYRFGIEKNRVFLDFQPCIHILVDKNKEKAKLEKMVNAIKIYCYTELKKHDPFNVISEDSVSIVFLLKSKIDPGKLSGILMTT